MALFQTSVVNKYLKQQDEDAVAKAQTLKTEIDKTDAGINAMVYELYGLSEEEIKIVEGC